MPSKATFGDTLVEDYKIRDYIMKKKLYKSTAKSFSSFQDQRSSVRSAITGNKIHILLPQSPVCVIGAKGAEIEKLRAEISKIAGGKDVNIKYR